MLFNVTIYLANTFSTAHINIDGTRISMTLAVILSLQTLPNLSEVNP